MTEEKSTEALFNKVDASSLFSALRNITDSGLILLDSDLRCLFINDRAKMIFNIDPQESFSDEAQIGLLGPLLKEFQTAREGQIKKDLRLNLRGIENEKTVGTLSSPIISSGRKMGYVICLSDITAAREKEKLQLEFVNHVSHEMRTPLTVMKEFTAILLDGLGGEVNITQKKYLSVIHNNIKRLDKIIGTLLDASRLDAGRTKLTREITNITRLIKQVVYVLGLHPEKSGIKLTCKLPHTLPPARVDADKITQVLINLVENSIKYTPEGGSVKLSAKKVNDYIEVSVSDTGIGISMEDRERVFDKFYQIGVKPGPGAKGVGLGLAITKQIVLMHGGRIWVDSTLGKGSTFTFTVPAVGKIKDLSSYVSECIDLAGVMRKTFTLMRITPSGREAVHVIKKQLRKATDSDPILAGKNLFIGLSNTNKKQANILRERLSGAFNSQSITDIRFGLASFPEDAETSEEIIKHCLKTEADG